MIYLAYDGSVNGDWLAHYAIGLAVRHVSRELHIVYVNDGKLPEERIREKVSRIEADCKAHGIKPVFEALPLDGGVFEALTDFIPTGSDTFVICGARIAGKKKGLLSGTISKRLLEYEHYNTIAIRVLQPGLLGVPHRFLFPVAGSPQGFLSGLPILKLFTPTIQSLHIFRVMEVDQYRYRRMKLDQVTRLREKGLAYTHGIEKQLLEQTGIDQSLVDVNVVVSDDWAREVIILAGRLKMHLICMEASKRNLKDRFIFSNPLEKILQNATCDVALYRGFQQ